jgi:hypothetical protein
MILSEQKRVEDGKREKGRLQYEAVRCIRNKLVDKMDRDNTYQECDGETDPLVNVSIEQIGELSAPELVEFIVAHDPNITTKNQIKKVNKGKIEEAKNALVNNLPPEVFNSTILLAFRCRGMQCKINLDGPQSSSEVNRRR